MTRVKICGLTRPVDIEAVNRAKPDYIGFVFAPSRRRVDTQTAAALRAQLAPGIVPVGVFADAPAEQILSLYERGIIAAAQLHGSEPPELLHALRKRSPLPLIRALRMSENPDIPLWLPLCDHLLLDSGGGSGQAFDWRRIPPGCGDYFLAGGIGLHNLAAALALSPFAVDLSSGAETDGYKDAQKIKELVERVRGDDEGRRRPAF